MPSPFPGMDPYIERPAIWPDFHDRLIASIVGKLQPQLRPRFAAVTQDRLYLVESDRAVYPDVAIIETPQPNRRDGGSTAVLEVDAPTVFEFDEEEIREPFIEIVEPSSGRIVTTIEVISPPNKDRGKGHYAYEQRREQHWDAGANVVEIDLLRAGASIVRVAKHKLDGLRPWDYVVAVSRRAPGRHEVYTFALERRLPRISIPLLRKVPDVALDLQAAFDRCWDEGPYPGMSRYDDPPPGEMSAERIAWCQQRLRDAGYLKP
jgi:hypothetical protein